MTLSNIVLEFAKFSSKKIFLLVLLKKFLNSLSNFFDKIIKSDFDKIFIASIVKSKKSFGFDPII